MPMDALFLGRDRHWKHHITNCSSRMKLDDSEVFVDVSCISELTGPTFKKVVRDLARTCGVAVQL